MYNKSVINVSASVKWLQVLKSYKNLHFFLRILASAPCETDGVQLNPARPCEKLAEVEQFANGMQEFWIAKIQDSEIADGRSTRAGELVKPKAHSRKRVR